MNDQRLHKPATSNWAPLWLYLVAVVGGNHLRRLALPDGSTPALRLVLALAFSALLIAAITLVHRATRP